MLSRKPCGFLSPFQEVKEVKIILIILRRYLFFLLSFSPECTVEFSKVIWYVILQQIECKAGVRIQLSSVMSDIKGFAKLQNNAKNIVTFHNNLLFMLKYIRLLYF